MTADKKVVQVWTRSSFVKVYRLFTDVVELVTLLKWKGAAIILLLITRLF